ncbi:hypothetical protein BH10PSE16_BH10PSE16_18880 [soil metagenome]
MKIVGTGFLSKEGVAQAEQLQERLAPMLSLVERAVQMCHVGMLVATVEEQKTPLEKQRIIACIVLARLLEISESIVLLARCALGVEQE